MKINEIINEGVNPTYLWHGSRNRIPVLTPRQAIDTGGAEGSNQNAIYATADPKFAIAMGMTTAGSDIAMFPESPQMVLFSGKIRKGEMVYLHKLPMKDANGKEQFIRHNDEYYSVPGVTEIKPVEIKEVPVNKYLTLIRKATPADLKLQQKYLKGNQVTNEGGWASTLTQGTIITPQLVQQCMKLLTTQFIPNLNKFLESKGLGPTEISGAGGSATYYERDLQQQPDKEYGDVDVQFHIPRIPDTTNNANADIFRKAIKEFCDSNPNYSTENGTNIILQIGKEYVQIDLIMSYFANKSWTRALKPEWNLKGVLCNSLYSSLGEVLNLSIGGGHGVQAKLQGGQIVPFRTVKDVELKTVTNNPKTWALDIVKFLGGKHISPRLKQYPGLIGGEVRVSDMINSIRGILESLGKEELIPKVKEIYLGKINAAINSSKYNKAETPQAIEHAKHTKEMLAQKSSEIAKLFGA